VRRGVWGDRLRSTQDFHLSSRNAKQKTPRQHGYLGSYKKRTKRLFLVLSRIVQAAQTPEFAKVFCFFSSEKKAFLLSALTKAR